MHKDYLEKLYGKHNQGVIDWPDLPQDYYTFCVYNRCTRSNNKRTARRYQNKSHRLRAKELIRRGKYYHIEKYIPDTWMWS